MKILVKSDTYNICKRIKQFDANYYIVYDNELNKFMVYSTNTYGVKTNIQGKMLGYVCTLPFNELDTRTFKYLCDTRSENIEKLIEQIDKENQQLEYQNRQELKNQSLNLAETKLRQLTR